MTASRPLNTDPRWQDIFPDQAALEAHVHRWPVGEAVPGDMAGVLRVARSLLVHSYVEYEFSHVAVAWLLLALEASLYVCLGTQGEQTLGPLIEQAENAGLVDEEESRALNGLRSLRNAIVHGGLLPSFAPASAVELAELIHDAISDIYGRAASR